MRLPSKNGRNHKIAQIFVGVLANPGLMGTVKKMELPTAKDSEKPRRILNDSIHNDRAISIYQQARPGRTNREKSREKSSNMYPQRHPTIDVLPSLTHDTIFNEFCFAVNLSNQVVVANKRAFPFRAYIEKGNNGLLLRSVLNKRWWWHSVEETEGCNLLWSEWHRTDFTETLPTLTHATKPMDESI